MSSGLYWVRFGLIGGWYGAIAGACAGSLYQVVRRTVPLILMHLGIAPGGPLLPPLFDSHLGMIALLGGLGGLFFGALLGVPAGLLAAVVHRRWSPAHSSRADRGPRIRAAVMAVLGAGWVANAAISPVGWLEVVSMIELGVVMLGAGWWLGGRLAAVDALAPR